MRTHKIAIFYEVTQQAIKPPAIRELERKDRWIKEVQKSVEADWKPLYIKTTYEIHNPDIEKQRKFFNGTCVKYYAIQNENFTSGVLPNEVLKKYRETMLDELLGYDLELVGKTVRRRKSTSDFKSVQAWNKLLNLAEEVLFEPAGFEFPDSKEFWELAKQNGYEQAERIAIQTLQARLIKKHG